MAKPCSMQKNASFTIMPSSPVSAGTIGTWNITIVVGPRGIDDGGTIKLAQRGSTDWGTPQFAYPEREGYSRIIHQSSATLTPRFGFKENIRPYFWCLTIDVTGDSLAPGDIVTVVLGDTSHGSIGIRAQSFQETDHQFVLDVDPTNSNAPRRTDEAYLTIIPGPAVCAKAIVPSLAAVGSLIPIYVRAEDQWGNPVSEVSMRSIAWQGSGRGSIDGDMLVLSERSAGYVVVTIQANGCDFTTRSNPIRTLHENEVMVYWGDMHAQTGETVGAGDEDQYFTFARDIAHLDFASHQGNDFQISDSYWEHLNQVSEKYNCEGSFVVFPGYEWSGNTSVGGDRNVWYLEKEQPIYRSNDWLIKDGIRDPLAETAQDLFAKLREHVGQGKYLVGAHVGGRYADIQYGIDEINGPLVEVVSCWGIFEWIIFDAFKKGYRIGIVANSDGHKGRPGAEHPGALDFGIRGGLTAVRSPGLTRRAILSALLSRHCYGTTGARILLDCQIGDHLPGDVVVLNEASKLTYAVMGCAALERIELFCGSEVIECHWADEFVSDRRSKRIRILWGGSETRGRTRRIHWQGKISTCKNISITNITPISFDSPADSIVLIDQHTIDFRSRTTGDRDGVEICFEGEGTFTFSSNRANEEFASNSLQQFNKPDFRPQGGLDAFVTACGYPECTETLTMEGAFSIKASLKEIPYFIKVTQVDGEMAWCSPWYVCPS